MIMKTLKFDFTLHYVPGKYQYLADALSRNPSDQYCDSTEDIDDPTVSVHSIAIIQPNQVENFQAATQQDKELMAVRRYVENGWPSRKI